MTARKCNITLVSFMALAALWLAAASRVHVNTSWSHDAWGYLALPLMGDTAGRAHDQHLGGQRPFEGPADIGCLDLGFALEQAGPRHLQRAAILRVGLDPATKRIIRLPSPGNLKLDDGSVSRPRRTRG